MLLAHAGKWLLVWYLIIACLAFYPLDRIWQIGSGEVGGAIWLSVTLGAGWMLVRDFRREIAGDGRR
jgi:hypothetical protein